MKLRLPPVVLMSRLWVTIVGIGLSLGAAGPEFVAAEQPITLDDVAEGLPDISADEPLAASFSAKKAAEYLDRSALKNPTVRSTAVRAASLGGAGGCQPATSESAVTAWRIPRRRATSSERASAAVCSDGSVWSSELTTG